MVCNINAIPQCHQQRHKRKCLKKEITNKKKTEEYKNCLEIFSDC